MAHSDEAHVDTLSILSKLHLARQPGPAPSAWRLSILSKLHQMNMFKAMEELGLELDFQFFLSCIQMSKRRRAWGLAAWRLSILSKLHPPHPALGGLRGPFRAFQFFLSCIRELLRRGIYIISLVMPRSLLDAYKHPCDTCVASSLEL